MDATSQNDLRRERDLAFFGAISASLSHELNNVMAIVGELSGLMEDLLQAEEKGMPLKSDRLRGISEKIAAQTKRGKDLIKRLNRFAHTVDRPLASVELRDHLELIVTLCRRFATLNRVELTADFPCAGWVLETYPFGLLHAVYLCIRLGLASAEAERKVALSCELDSNTARVVVESAESLRPGPETEADLNFLRLLTKQLGAAVEQLPANGNGCRFVLRFPRIHEGSTG